MKHKSYKALIGTGVFAVISTSLCCTLPILAFILGVSGFASAFSWMEQFRPYLVGLSVFTLGLAWYRKLIPSIKYSYVTDKCTAHEKGQFLAVKNFLGIVTAFSLTMLGFSYYTHLFYSSPESKLVIVESNNIKEANFEIQGMTCTGCEKRVKHAINQLQGIITVTASYKKKVIQIKFDATKTTIAEIKQTINSTGYTAQLKGGQE